MPADNNLLALKIIDKVRVHSEGQHEVCVDANSQVVVHFVFVFMLNRVICAFQHVVREVTILKALRSTKLALHFLGSTQVPL